MYQRNLIAVFLGLIWMLPDPAASQVQKRPAPFVKQVAAARSIFDEMRHDTNDIALSIMTSGMSCTCARFAEDIRNVVNDLRPNGIRVLPVLGVGGLQNLKDVLFMKGVDMAVADQDNVRMLKERDPKLYANLEGHVQYITKLYTAEFHVLARNDIKSYSDLKGQKVNFNLKDSQTDVTADRVFNMLDLQVQRSHYDNDEAIQKLLKGEISAMIVLTGGPQAALATLKAEDGVHFLALDKASVPDRDVSKILAEYPTVQMTSKLYPKLIPEGTSVSTIANYALLVVYAWPENSERYRRLTRFVNEFFGKVEQLKDGARHPKWAEFDVATDIPGWTRFKPAADWIAQHGETAKSSASTLQASATSETQPAELSDLRSSLAKVLEDSGGSNGDKPMTRHERALLIIVKQLLEKQSQAHAKQVDR
jgi:TRAP-type uncharacterized transport system substrate-binding protein